MDALELLALLDLLQHDVDRSLVVLSDLDPLVAFALFRLLSTFLVLVMQRPRLLQRLFRRRQPVRGSLCRLLTDDFVPFHLLVAVLFLVFVRLGSIELGSWRLRPLDRSAGGDLLHLDFVRVAACHLEPSSLSVDLTLTVRRGLSAVGRRDDRPAPGRSHL